DCRRDARAVWLQRVGQPPAVRRGGSALRRGVPSRSEEQLRRDPRDPGPYRLGGAAVAVPVAGAAEPGGAAGEGPDLPGGGARALEGNRSRAAGVPVRVHRRAARLDAGGEAVDGGGGSSTVWGDVA